MKNIIITIGSLLVVLSILMLIYSGDVGGWSVVPLEDIEAQSGYIFNEENGENSIVFTPIPSVIHTGYPSGALAQDILVYAYDRYRDREFIKMLECENGTYDLKRYGDNGHAMGLCQLNDHWHWYDIYGTDYLDDYIVAVDICYEHWIQHTHFYGYETRKVNGVPCPVAVSNRFIFNF